MVKLSNPNFTLFINHESDVPKYQQIIDNINHAIAENILHKGDVLPSVNFICKSFQLSRDTVFKAYSILKEQHIIESVPNKGYFVANEIRKVLLVLDTFKAYKEVLYHSFIDNLPNNFIVDVQFHHYNFENFKSILNGSFGKYHKYIVMNFDHKEIPSLLSKINRNRLLLIDWKIQEKPNNNYLFQDFGKAFYEALEQALITIKKYSKVIYVFPKYSYHPKESCTYFNKFIKNYKLKGETIFHSSDFKVEKNIAYISVSDRVLGRFLEQCKANNFEPGVDVGFLSYNETPMKKFIYKGISVVSTDFKEMGTKAAEFVRNGGQMQYCVPTKLILRESL